jgi:hypothetical protein
MKIPIFSLDKLVCYKPVSLIKMNRSYLLNLKKQQPLNKQQQKINIELLYT